LNGRELGTATVNSMKEIMKRAGAKPVRNIVPVMPEGQSLSAKAAEVQFRRDLCHYRINREPLFNDEFDGDEIVSIFRERMAAAVADVSSLPEASSIRNCLEIGAECCQRTAAIADHFDIPCYAVDISLDSLLAINSYAPKVGARSLPYRICCDLITLPFRSGSFDLVVAYQTLHHFVNPSLVVAQVHRVNRHIFMGCDEPTRRYLHFLVGTQRFGIYSAQTLSKNHYRRLVEDFFLEHRSNEVAYGIIENERLSLGDWRRSLEPWYECQWFHGPGIANGELIGVGCWGTLKWAAESLTGSMISFVGRVRGSVKLENKGEAVLVCPDCLQNDGSEQAVHSVSEGLRCYHCETLFPKVNGVAVLLPTQLRRTLYPTLL
jgi:SAM-dependent methyltransferase/uncharacterized protein YbaR (Trm112 family)